MNSVNAKQTISETHHILDICMISKLVRQNFDIDFDVHGMSLTQY